MRIKQLLAICLVSLQLLSFGCAKSSDSYDAMNMIDHAKEQEKEEVAHIRLTKKEDMDKHYGNGLYYEDLDEERATLNKEYQNYVEKLFRSKSNNPLIVRVDAVFYNESLLKIKQGQLSYDDAIQNAAEHLRSLKIHLYGFTNPDDYVRHSEIFEFIKEYQTDLCTFSFEPNTIYLTVYDESILEEEIPSFLDRDMSIDELYIRLSEYEQIVDMVVFNNGESKYKSEKSRITQKTFDDYTIMFEEQFNEPFVYTRDAIFPKNNPNLKIYYNTGAGSYTKLMAQKIMAEEINKIIEEEGGDPRIVQYTAAVSSDESKTNEASFDTRKNFDRLEFIREVYYGSFDTNILYLKTEDEEIDFDLLYRVLDRVLGIYAEEYTRPSRNHSVLVYFYNVDEEDYVVVSDLFKEQALFMPVNTKSKGLKDIYANMYVTHVESDGYYYLDVYGEKEEYLLHMHPIKDEYRDRSPEEILKIYRDKNEFGGEYEYDNW